MERTVKLKSGETIIARSIVARFPDRCSRCGGPIAPGDAIWYHSRLKPSHVECPADAIAAKAERESRESVEAGVLATIQSPDGRRLVFRGGDAGISRCTILPDGRRMAELPVSRTEMLAAVKAAKERGWEVEHA